MLYYGMVYIYKRSMTESIKLHVTCCALTGLSIEQVETWINGIHYINSGIGVTVYVHI